MHEQEIKRLLQEFQGVKQKLQMQIDNLKERNSEISNKLEGLGKDHQTVVTELEARLNSAEVAHASLFEKTKDFDS